MAQCRVCFQFLKPPVKLLICGHSFCHNCTKRLVHGESVCHVCTDKFGEEEFVRKITCPVCRQSTPVTSDGIEALPPNYSLNTLLDRLLIKLGNKERPNEYDNCGKQSEMQSQTVCFQDDTLQFDYSSDANSFSVHLSPEYKNRSYHCLNDIMTKLDSLCETANSSVVDNRVPFLKLFRPNIHDQGDHFSYGPMPKTTSDYDTQEISLISKRDIRFDICELCDHTLSPPVKFLPCGHSFCAKCIKDQHSMQCQKRNIICKVCGRKSTLPDGQIDGLPINFAFHKLLERMKDPADEMSINLSSSTRSYHVSFVTDSSNEFSSTQFITTSIHLSPLPLSLPEIVGDETDFYQLRNDLQTTYSYSETTEHSWTNEITNSQLDLISSNDLVSIDTGDRSDSYYAFKRPVVIDDDSLIEFDLFPV